MEEVREEGEKKAFQTKIWEDDEAIGMPRRYWFGLSS